MLINFYGNMILWDICLLWQWIIMNVPCMWNKLLLALPNIVSLSTHAACIVACLDDNDDDDEMRWWDGDDDEDDDDGDSDENMMMMMMRWWRWQWGLWWWWHPHIPPPCPSQFLLGQTSLMCESYSVMCILSSSSFSCVIFTLFVAMTINVRR